MNRYLAGRTRPLALFVWAHVTRAATLDSNLFDWGYGDNASMAGRNVFPGGLPNSVGPKRASVSFAGSVSTTAWTQARAFSAAWGNIPPFNGTNPNDSRSWILYSIHIVDVLASGRTFAELDAADAAAYAEAFGQGGRFFGDPWTNPDTLIPS